MAKGPGFTLNTKGSGPGSGRDEKWCRLCEHDLGEKRKAHRIMPKDGGRCEEHYRHDAGEPQRTPEAIEFIKRWKKVVQERDAAAQTDSDSQSGDSSAVERHLPTQAAGSTPAPRSISNKEETRMGKLTMGVIAEMRKDLDAGMSINAIAEKHGSSWPTVKNVLGGGKNGAAKNGHAKKNGRAAAHSSANGAPTNGAGAVQVGVELLDRMWSTLAPEKKAELLKAL